MLFPLWKGVPTVEMYLCCGNVILGVYLLYNIDRLRQSAAVLPFAAVFRITRFPFNLFLFFYSPLHSVRLQAFNSFSCLCHCCQPRFVLVCNPSCQVSTQNADSAAGTLELFVDSLKDCS